jgi:hypothetical protein
MKVNWRVAVFSTVLAFAGYQTAQAQTPSYNISDSAVQYTSTAYLGNDGCAVDPTCAADCTDGCTSMGSSCEPWKLFDVNHGCRKIEVGGWISGGVTVADHNVNNTAPMAFVNPIDEVLLNQAWIYVERAADTGGCGFDWGYRVDYVYGADGPDTQAFGDQDWDYGWDYNANYGSAIPQLYGTVAYNNLSVNIGHFFTTIGYEVVPATGNFFYSHAYTMNYGEPFTHTGFLASYAANDNLTVYGGYTFGWDSGFNNRLDASTFLGGFTFSVSDNVDLAYMTTTGNLGDGLGNIYMHSIVATVDVSCKTQYVLQSDYGTNTELGVGTGNEWYGINQYVFHTLNDNWKLGARYEIFRDEAGTASPAGRVGNGSETYSAATLGLNWTPHTNVTVRPEARWDWVNKNSGSFGGNNSLFTAGVDAIFTF